MLMHADSHRPIVDLEYTFYSRNVICWCILPVNHLSLLKLLKYLNIKKLAMSLKGKPLQCNLGAIIKFCFIAGSLRHHCTKLPLSPDILVVDSYCCCQRHVRTCMLLAGLHGSTTASFLPGYEVNSGKATKWAITAS